MDIYIRTIDIPDALTVLNWENNTENWDASDNKGEYQLFDIVRMIEESQDIHKICQGRWMICDKSNDALIGTTDLFAIDFEAGFATVGILIAEKENRQKGLASKALELLELEANRLELQKMHCAIHPDNDSSIKLFEKVGFKLAGETDEVFGHNGVIKKASIYEKWLKK